MRKTTHRHGIRIQHLNDIPMYCDEKHQVGIKRYIYNGLVKFGVEFTEGDYLYLFHFLAMFKFAMFLKV